VRNSSSAVARPCGSPLHTSSGLVSKPLGICVATLNAPGDGSLIEQWMMTDAGAALPNAGVLGRIALVRSLGAAGCCRCWPRWWARRSRSWRRSPERDLLRGRRDKDAWVSRFWGATVVRA
jgi:hypothetical protein